MKTNTIHFTTRDHSCAIFWSSSENHWQTAAHLKLCSSAVKLNQKESPHPTDLKWPSVSFTMHFKLLFLIHKAFNVLWPSYIDTLFIFKGSTETSHSCKLYYFKAFNPHVKHHLSTDQENSTVPFILKKVCHHIQSLSLVITPHGLYDEIQKHRSPAPDGKKREQHLSTCWQTQSWCELRKSPNRRWMTETRHLTGRSFMHHQLKTNEFHWG